MIHVTLGRIVIVTMTFITLLRVLEISLGLIGVIVISFISSSYHNLSMTVGAGARSIVLIRYWICKAPTIASSALQPSTSLSK